MILDLKFILLIYSIVAVVLIILERRRPEKTIAWLIVFLVFPILGIVIYTFLGRNWTKNKLKDNDINLAQDLVKAYDVKVKGNKYCDLMELIKKNNSSPIFYRNKIVILNNGMEKFKLLKEKLKGAKNHIHIEYYIFKSDNIGKEIMNILIEKAKKGIEVRMVLDRVGTISLNKKHIKELRKAGVDVVIYNYFLAPILRFINTQINYRNHRKIVVIDGEIAFVGGINVGDEYLGKGKLGFWRDTHLMIEGDCVLGFQAVFMDDFSMIKKIQYENLGYKGKIDDYFKNFKEEGKMLQIAKSGPDSKNPTIMQSLILMINKAEKHVYITTPYFIPSESVMTALKISALSGVNIKILFPGQSDHFTVYYASRTYLAELMEYGVEVYFYDKKSFIHSKVITIDGEIGMVGTANLDIRSFELNYEINTIIYDREITEELEGQFSKDLMRSELVHKNYFKNNKISIKVLESTMRVFSNLL